MEDNIVKAKVINIVSENSALLPGTDIVERTQDITAVLPTGENVLVKNSYTNVSPNQKVYIEKISNNAGISYQVVGVSREPVLFVLLGLFALITVLVGRKQGLRGLISLAITITIIFTFLVPRLLKGANPFFIILPTTLFLVAISALITHGRNRVTYSAILGMCTTLIITAIIGVFTFAAANLTGVNSESSVYFMVSQNGQINMQSLFLGAVLIGLLGVLYDAAISQAVYIAETLKNSKNISKKDLLKTSMSFGREHIGALVDTLAIVSIGAALVDTLLIVKHATGPLGMILSNESVSSHILQILVGSIGVIIAIPITSFIALRMLYGKEDSVLDTKHSHQH